MEEREKNPLGTEPIPGLLRKFAVPSIIAMLTGALYNIVDQFFIGNSVGELGNAATNVAFPFTTCCLAIGLLFGIGGASAFNLAKGRGQNEDAVHYMGNAVAGILVLGCTLMLFTQLFLTPVIRFFGAPDSIMEYARTYVRITSLGFPMTILATGGGHLIRADGSPAYSMLCNMTGAVVNTILDALFVFGFGMGMAGAALATIIGQYLSAFLVIRYLAGHCKTARLGRSHLRPRKQYLIRVASLGAAPATNQLSMMVVQLVMNRSLTYYGGLSSYGQEIPLACAGIISKVSLLCHSLIIGISQGQQPIASFNYGAEKYQRVKSVYLLGVKIGAVISATAFLAFQFLPRQIIGVFGNGSEAYIEFAVRYFRVYLFFTFVNFMQPMTSNFFTATGRPKMGMFLSLTRQIIFLLPLIVLLPLFIGIDGILFAGPVADGLAAVVSIAMISRELRRSEYKAS